MNDKQYEKTYDEIHIENLQVFANHGVFPEENVLGQKFLVSAVLYLDTRAAGKADDLTLSTHYGEISRFMTDYLKDHTYKLIEAAAEHLAEAVLLTWPLVRGISLEIKKPWAPVGLPLDHVSVKITRFWHTAYIALGSNMGDREGYLNMAVKRLGEEPGCTVKKVSDFIVTAPYGIVEQDDFLNGCLTLETLLSPEDLLDLLHRIEAEADRKREIHWGPRTLDLDILLYDDLMMASEDLTIPHIEMHLRDFVLTPLCQIAPWAWHPGLGKTAAALKAELAAKAALTAKAELAEKAELAAKA